MAGKSKVWDAQTGQELLTLTGHSESVRTVVFSPDGKRLASASDDNTVKIWDAQTGKETLTLKDCGLSVAFSPDGQHLVGGGEKGLKIWDATPLPEKP